MIQEYRYSVTDVVFEDVGDVAVPSAHLVLFESYCEEVDSFLADTPMWNAPGRGYKNCMLPKSRHKAYTKSLLCSGDEKKILAAIEAMERTLDKYFDSMQTEKAMRERQADRAAIKRACANMNKKYRKSSYSIVQGSTITEDDTDTIVQLVRIDEAS